jgi:hypothetical protein
MIKRKKTYILKTKSITALIVYFFLLSNIAFHHHPFSIALVSHNKFENTNNSDSQFVISSNSCSIVHFAQSSFQSLIDENSFEFQFEHSTLYSFEPSNHYYTTLLLHYSLRAPPLSTQNLV